MNNKKVTVTKVGNVVKIKGLNPVTPGEINDINYATEAEVKKVTVGKTYINVTPLYKSMLNELYEELYNKYNGTENKVSKKGASIGGSAGAMADLMS